MGTIITLSGASGCGKTTLARYLLQKFKNWQTIPIVTTRPMRSRDREDEFLVITLEEFLKKEKERGFLWVVNEPDKQYGVLKEHVRSALYREGVSVVMSPVNCLDIFAKCVAINKNKIFSIHLLSPEEVVLRERLVRRGDPPDEVAIRLSDYKNWDKEARELKIPVYFLDNGGTREAFFEKVDALSSRIII